MAFQKQTGYTKTFTKPAAGSAPASGTATAKGAGAKPTHYVKNKETKEFVNQISVWENASKFEDGSPVFNIIVSEPIPAGTYTMQAKRVKTDA